VKRSPTKLREDFAHRLVIETDDPRLSLLLRGLACLLALAALTRLFPFSSSALLLSLLSFALWQLASVIDVQTEAVFDRARGRFSLVHRRKGTVVSRTEATLRAVEATVVEARRDKQGVSMRPAVVIAGRRMALSHGSFMDPSQALALVASVRTFLGKPEGDIIADSIGWSTRLAQGRGPADATAAILSEPPPHDETRTSQKLAASERALAAESGNVALP
jgi:hypothetical protein